MIIQCAQCKARFRLDDSKVSDAGIKVRCSKCKHIFVVKKEAPVEESDLDVLLQGLGSPTAGTELATGAGTVATATAMPADQALEAATPPPAEEPFPFSGAPEEFSPSVVAESSEDREGYSVGIEPAEPEKPMADFEENTRPEEAFGGFEFEKDDSAAAAISGEAGFLASDSAMSEGGEERAGSGTIEEEEISFGEVSPEAFAAATGASASGVEGSEEEEISFEFEEADAAVYGENAEAEESATGDVDFGEIDFGIEDAEAESVSGGENLFSVSAASEPESAPMGKPAGEELPVTEIPPILPAAAAEGEAPPLSIASRRKGRSFLPSVVIAFSVLVIVALAGFGFYFFKEGPELLNRLGVGFLAEWFGVEGREEGVISLDKVGGTYLVNSEAGEVFVIRGEAVNNYRKPRAAIQVRGALLAAGGQAVVQKVAYCGNNLTDEQIKTLPFARIEAAMGNQFGDSLANLGVQAGKRIPFVIVIAKIPKDVVDYAVEVVGSTVASQ
ncbi:DUF3426 domain-containing protein [Geobacter grbiciae]|uniref:DUF3426 domain-containing protein n=1 Tax=Geobacter grbiciae TaxID=155042 RepID=UPI001C0162CA|nr:DUF3426 domain-containing protein [Geobacter grbiciae]MBT1076184.1 zinc-ribbon domain-containing protein [Geobacter grbiciae]